MQFANFPIPDNTKWDGEVTPYIDNYNIGIIVINKKTLYLDGIFQEYFCTFKKIFLGDL